MGFVDRGATAAGGGSIVGPAGETTSAVGAGAAAGGNAIGNAAGASGRGGAGGEGASEGEGVSPTPDAAVPLPY